MAGLIHNADKYGNTNKEDLLKKQLKGEIVGRRPGQATQFIQLNEPFAYQGVQLTINPNWKHQHIHLTEYLKGRLGGLSASYAPRGKS